MYFYLTYGDGINITLTEWENLSYKRLIRYVKRMERQKALEKKKIEENRRK